MGPLQTLEMKLDELLDKKAPIKIPTDGRRGLAHALWWIALIIGIIRLWSALQLWQWGHRADEILNSLSYYTGGTYVHHLGAFYYLALLAIGVVSILMLIATPSLKAMKKIGWDLLFYGALIQIASAVIELFANGGGFGDFLGGALGAVVGLYLLFQVRECFIMSRPVDHKTIPAAHHAAHAAEKTHDSADGTDDAAK
jgi:uncharacterized membrane protein